MLGVISCSGSGSISNRIGGRLASIRLGTIFSVGKITALSSTVPCLPATLIFHTQ